MRMKSLAIQLDICPDIPHIYGNIDYTRFRETLIKIDEILDTGGLEYKLIEACMDKMLVLKKYSTPKQEYKTNEKTYKQLSFALRCNIAINLTGESFRKFSIHLSDSKLFQWFTKINYFTKKKAISKSSLERFSKMFDASIIARILYKWQASFLTNKAKTEKLGLNDTMDFKDLFTDGTCVKANIHFPVDWVLLRDAARSLLLAIKTIRAQGLKTRMPKPSELMKTMNNYCISMTHTRRKKDGKKQRKKILRKMKKLMSRIKKHSKRYNNLLIKNQKQTNWSQAQTNIVLNRIKNILDQLPKAIKQAHERIIGERKVSSKDKILSLYDKDVHVIVRGKSSSEVEFGQGFILTEQRNGLIVDWELFQNQPKSDSRILKTITKRIQKYYGPIKSITGDRGFHSKANDEFLDKQNIFNAICPRNPMKLKERMCDPEFSKRQTRRNQTEARIGIFKNVFLGKPLRSKCFLHRQLSISWCVLTHNLWLIARLAISDEKRKLKKAA